MFRLLNALDEAIVSARIPREVPFLRAERAVLRARLGEIAQAREDVAALRALTITATSPALSAWLWLAEGLADYFENGNLRAHDRVRRAVAVSASLKANRLQALAAAWLALMEFRARDYPAMAKHLHATLRVAASDHHAARARACLVVATAYHYAGREDFARPWYAQARIHATAEGDQVSLSSMMYNMAVMQVMEVRLLERFGAADPSRARRAQLGTESSQLLDRTIQTKAFRHHSLMHRALILTAQQQFEAALSLFDRYLEPALAEGLAMSECQFRADRAWCLLEVGRGDDARIEARRASSAFRHATESEEQAIAHAVLAMVFERLGLAAESAHHAKHAHAQHATYREHCDSLLESLQSHPIEALRERPSVA